LSVAACATGALEIWVPPAATMSSPKGDVLTSRNDNLRTGANLEEEVLDPSSVKRLELVSRLFVDGELYAQPLVAGDVNGKTLVIAATMQSSVYAFDLDAPDGTPPLWHTGTAHELGTPGQSIRNVKGPNGILSTPVIDRASRTIYLVTRSCDAADQVTVGHCANKTTAPHCREILFAIDLETGAIKGRTDVTGTVKNAKGASIAFDSNVHWNRPALLLEQGSLYVAFGSGSNADQHEEDFEYHGWMFRYDVSDLTRAPAVYLTTPDFRGGSVWQAGSGPASDGKHVFFTGANGIFPDCTTHPPKDFSSTPPNADDSVVRLDVGFGAGSGELANPPAMKYADDRAYAAVGFSGTVVQFTNSGDCGFGSSGPTLIPDSSDFVVGSKDGLVYLLDRETMTARHPPLNAFTELPLKDDHTLYIHSWSGIPAIPGSLAFFRTDPGHALLYGWAGSDKLRSFRYDYAAHSLVLDRTADVPAKLGGGIMSVSAHGNAGGVVWASTWSTVDPKKLGPGHVWAFDALTLERLWDTEIPAHSKFTPITVARGKVIVPSARADGPKAVLVYGVAR
jgi:outer membrane protein assembly factor BamB